MTANHSVEHAPVSLKVSRDTKRKIRLAAFLSDTSVSAFVRAAAEKAADRTIQQASAKVPPPRAA